VELKHELRKVIDTVSNPDERLVLRYRYIHNYTWERIGQELGADSRTIRRWHGKALTHVILPENPIKI
jgi:RNA polymerase sigma factor (sigma-70 family)